MWLTSAIVLIEPPVSALLEEAFLWWVNRTMNTYPEGHVKKPYRR